MRREISDYKYVFCDSIEAIELAYEEGLSREATILTSSPSIIFNNNFKNKVIIADNRNDQKYLDFYYSSKLYLEEIFYKLKESESFSEYAVLASKVAQQQLRFIYATSLIDERFLSDETLVIGLEFEEKSLNSRFNNMWLEYLQEFYSIDNISYSVEITGERSIRDQAASLLNRLQIAGYEGVFYRVFISISKLLKKVGWKKNLYIISESDIVRESAFHMGLRGYSVNLYKYPTLRGVKVDERDMSELKAVLGMQVMNWIERIENKRCKELHFENFFNSLFSHISEYLTYRDFYKNEFQKDEYKKTVFFSNYPKGARVYGLAKACLDNGIPFASFQHGVTRELLNFKSMNNMINFENSYTPYLFVHNKTSRDIYESSPYKMIEGGAFEVGLPSDYLRLSRKQKNVEKKALYVSTLLYHGNIFTHIFPEPDHHLARWEIDLVQNIFDKLKYRIDFKPYPSVRYTDPDAVLSAVRNSRNVSLSGTDIDLRYIISGYDLIIVTQATSTIGWCAMSDIPMIYIDKDNRSRLERPAREAFERAFFYIDEASECWRDELQELLDMSFSERDELWNAKQEARQEVIKLFFSDTGRAKGAGKRVADIVCDSLFD